MNEHSQAELNDQYIDVGNPDEIRAWAIALGVTSTELKEAVKEMGASAHKVRTYLGVSGAVVPERPIHARHTPQKDDART